MTQAALGQLCGSTSSPHFSVTFTAVSRHPELVLSLGFQELLCCNFQPHFWHLFLSNRETSRNQLYDHFLYTACMWRLVSRSCPTLCDAMNSNPPGSSVHGILQARILEWVAISFSKPCPLVKVSLVIFKGNCTEVLWFLTRRGRKACWRRQHLNKDLERWVWVSRECVEEGHPEGIRIINPFYGWRKELEETELLAC